MKNYNEKKEITNGEIIDKILEGYFSLTYPEIIYDKISLREKIEMGELIKENSSIIAKKLKDYLMKKEVVDLFTEKTNQNILSYNIAEEKNGKEDLYDDLRKIIEEKSKRSSKMNSYDYIYINKNYFNSLSDKWDDPNIEKGIEIMDEMGILISYNYCVMKPNHEAFKFKEFIILIKLFRKILLENENYEYYIRFYSEHALDLLDISMLRFLTIDFMKELNEKFSLSSSSHTNTDDLLSQLLNFIKTVTIEEIKESENCQKILIFLVNEFRLYINNEKYLDINEFYRYED